MLCSRNAPKTIVLKSPDSDKVREVIITSVLLPKSENENNRTGITSFGYRPRDSLCIGQSMEKRICKRRLDHLTLEEKILRKKLKNREAAQTSRDKKKARMEELEASLIELQNENELLHEEVRSLKDDKESLARENTRLTEEVWRLSVAGEPSGPAVSCPLPQGVRPPPALHRPPPHQPLTRLLTFLLTLTLTTGTGSTQTPSLQSLKNLNNSQIHSLLKHVMLKVQKHRKKTWWGRRQKAWNPVGHVLKRAT